MGTPAHTLRFRIYEVEATDGPTVGALIGELTKVWGKTIRREYNDLGAGEFYINRHEDQAAWCVIDSTAPKRYVKAYLDDFSDPPIGGFFLTTAEVVAASDDEQGGETIHIGGPGPMSILRTARVHPKEYKAAVSGEWAATALGTWEWTNVAIGGPLIRQIEEAQERGAIPDVSVDFTRTHDSNGVAWDMTFDFSIAIGTDLWDLTQRLIEGGLIVEMDPDDFTLHAYATFGTDLSDDVHFVYGVNIRGENTASKNIEAEGGGSWALVKGRDVGTGGGSAFLTVDEVATRGIGHVEIFGEHTNTARVTFLTRFGRRLITNAMNKYDGTATVGVVEVVDAIGTRFASPYDKVALVDYVPGDTVFLDIPDVYDEQSPQVTAITLVETEGGEYDPIVEMAYLASGTGGVVIVTPPGGTPWVPCPPATPTTTFGIRRKVVVTGTTTDHAFTWADAVDMDGNPDPGDPVEGSTLVCAAVFRDPGDIFHMTDLEFVNEISAQTQFESLGHEVIIGSRTVHANDTETQRWSVTTSSLEGWAHPAEAQASVIYELSGPATVTDTTTSGPTFPPPNTLTTGSATVGANAVMIGACRIDSADFSGAAFVTPDADVIEDAEIGDGPDAFIAHRFSTGEITASSTFPDPLRNDHGGAAAVFTSTETESDADPCPPPVPGQPVAPLEITVTDCALMGYTVPTGSYAPHTLHVYVRDGARLIPVLFIEADPDAGVFRLLESPCATVPATTENVTIFDVAADEWKFVFLSDGTPVTISIPGASSTTLPTLVVDYIAGATSGAPTDPPIVVEPPPAIPPVTVTDWYPGSPGVGSDQSAAIEAWIAATAGVGRVLGIAPGIYRTDARIFNDTVDDISLVMTGATLKRVDTAASGDPILTFWSCDNLAVYNPTIQGPASTSDVASVVYPGTRESEHGIELVDCHGVTLSHPSITNVWGDGIYYSRIGAGAPSTLCTDVVIDTPFVRTSGRNAISHISGQRIRIKDLVCSDISLHGFDVEGNASDDVCADVTITGTATSITDFGTGFASHGVTGFAIQVGPGFGGNVPTRVLLENGAMDLAQINVQGPSSGSPAQDITFRGWRATSAGTSQVVHVADWVNSGNDSHFSLPASGNVT